MADWATMEYAGGNGAGGLEAISGERVLSAAAAADSGSQERNISGILHSLICRTRACTYNALEYFVAWQGVLTIVYSGIPPSLSQLKQNIDGDLEGLVKENPGSKWPKTSIACLRDDKVLTYSQLLRLRQICSEESPALAAAVPIMVGNLSVVLYENCCLEKTMLVATIPLALPQDMSKPTPEERSHIREILDEFALENLENYHTHTSKAGNRSAHYRNPTVGATLVHFLKTTPTTLSGFRERIESEFPGMYDWFLDSSLHITLRALS